MLWDPFSTTSFFQVLLSPDLFVHTTKKRKQRERERPRSFYMRGVEYICVYNGSGEIGFDRISFRRRKMKTDRGGKVCERWALSVVTSESGRFKGGKMEFKAIVVACITPTRPAGLVEACFLMRTLPRIRDEVPYTWDECGLTKVNLFSNEWEEAFYYYYFFELFGHAFLRGLKEPIFRGRFWHLVEFQPIK